MTGQDQKTEPLVIEQWRPLALLAATLAHIITCIYFLTLFSAAAGAYLGLNHMGTHPGLSLSAFFAIFLLPTIAIRAYCKIKNKSIMDLHKAQTCCPNPFDHARAEREYRRWQLKILAVAAALYTAIGIIGFLTIMTLPQLNANIGRHWTTALLPTIPIVTSIILGALLTMGIQAAQSNPNRCHRHTDQPIKFRPSASRKGCGLDS